MNSQQAREILNACRPGGIDQTDPQIRAAMEQMERDPELARWFAGQHSFDRTMAGTLQSIDVPLDLRQAILAARRKANANRSPAWWWRPAWSSWQLRAGAAAAIVFMAAVITGAFSNTRTPTRFADFRKELIQESWNQNHLAYRSANIYHVRQWLATNDGPTAFSLPPEFRNRQLQGCNLVDVGGQPVAVLCFAQGSRHLHLYVAEGVQFADLPKKGTPEFARCGQWKTASWQDGKRTFVLSGMSAPRFVNTFRKAGRWTMSG